MSVSSISDFTILGDYLTKLKDDKSKTNNNAAFDSLLQSAVNMIKETNQTTNAAEEEAMAFASGYSDDLVALQAAQSKAYYSLQYTVTVRNMVLDAYKEIMNLQF